MVNASSKANDEWGIPGYENVYTKFNAHYDKPTVFGIPKDKAERDYISIV